MGPSTERTERLETVEEILQRTPQVVTSVPFPEVLIQTMLQAIRRIEQGQVDNASMLLDARERLIRLEQAEHAAKIEGLRSEHGKLKERVEKLETEAAERRGMQKLVDWFVRYGWVLLCIVVGAVLIVTGKVGLK